MKKQRKKKQISLAGLLIVILYFALTGNLPSQETVSQTSGIEQTSQSKNKQVSSKADTTQSADNVDYSFRSDKLWMEHFEKHGEEMGFDSAEEYLDAANDVIDDPDVLHKTEKEDGDDVYYLEDTNEFVVVSTDGYLRTYFEPSDGIEYYERQ